MKTKFKLDANETAFFNRSLEVVKSRTYDVKFKQLKAFELIPVSTEANAGADTIVYRSYEGIGIAKIISDYAHDFPRVDTIGTEKSVKVHDIGDSYGYSIKEVRRASVANTQLDQRRATSARRAIDELVNNLAFSGDADYGINGFIDYPGITQGTIPADGTGSEKAWALKTPDQIVRDVTNLINAVMVPTNGREQPDTLLLPLEQYNLIANTRMTDGNDKTIMTFIVENNPYLTSIQWLSELDGAGAGGLDRAMVYTKDADHLTLEMPLAFEQFPVQWEGMEGVIPCHAETAGVIVYYPQAVAYGDGI